jgi:hypothetical protein
MVPVGMMQVAVDQIVDVVAVRHRLVPAPGSMHVARLVTGAAVLRRAAVRIARRDLDHVLVSMIAMRMVQVTIVKIVDVIAVANGRMAAIGAVLMRVIGVFRICASGHGWPPYSASESATIIEIGPRRHLTAPLGRSIGSRASVMIEKFDIAHGTV